MRIRRPLTTLTAAAAAAVLASCSVLGSTATTDTASTDTNATTTASVVSDAVAGLTPDEARADNADVTVDDADLAYDESSAVTVALDGDTARAASGLRQMTELGQRDGALQAAVELLLDAHLGGLRR